MAKAFHIFGLIDSFRFGIACHAAKHVTASVVAAPATRP
jgi:hypothetical protein